MFFRKQLEPMSAVPDDRGAVGEDTNKAPATPPSENEKRECRHSAFYSHEHLRRGLLTCSFLAHSCKISPPITSQHQALFVHLRLTRAIMTMTMTMITKLVLRARVREPWPLFGEKFASCRHNVSGCTCSDLVPVDLKWACTCAGKGDVVHSL